MNSFALMVPRPLNIFTRRVIDRFFAARPVQNFSDLHRLLKTSKDLEAEITLVPIEMLWAVALRMDRGIVVHRLNSEIAQIVATNKERAIEALEWLIQMGGGTCPT